jgi:cell division protein FtsW
MTTRGHDRMLAAAVAVLLVLGLVMVQSASGPESAESIGDAWFYVKRQAIAIVVGLSLCLTAALVPYQWLKKGAWLLYAGVLFGLILLMVPGIGREVNGATRWIGVGGFNIQPSEFAKVALILVTSMLISRNVGRLNDLKVSSLIFLAPLPLLVLVLMQPDFGTTALLLGLTFVLFFVGGLPTRFLWTSAVAMVVLAVPVVGFASYRMRRLQSFLDPWADAAGSGYQVIQSMIAFQSGGLMGQGLGESHAKHMFLPEPWTDFVGSVMAEELGFIGVLFLLSLYALVVFRGISIAKRAPDFFGLLVAAAVTALLAGQALLNLGVAMGVLPPKGLVLPFMSYGGSAIMVHLLCVGLLLNISANGRAESTRMLSPYRRAAVSEVPA